MKFDHATCNMSDSTHFTIVSSNVVIGDTNVLADAYGVCTIVSNVVIELCILLCSLLSSCSFCILYLLDGGK